MGSIDLWSLDVEGAELEVLRTVDFSRLQVSTGSSHQLPRTCSRHRLVQACAKSQPGTVRPNPPCCGPVVWLAKRAVSGGQGAGSKDHHMAMWHGLQSLGCSGLMHGLTGAWSVLACRSRC